MPVTEAPHDPDVRSVLPEGASLIVMVRPRELFEAEPTALMIHGLVPDTQLESIRVQHGIDLRTLERLAFAEYEAGEASGRVIVLQGPFRAEVAVAEIAHRMVPLESSSVGPPRRAGGVMHGTRMDAIALGEHTLVLVVGPPELSARVMRTVDGSAPPAIAGPVQQAIARHSEPLVAIRPVPLDLPPGGAVSLLLAEEESMLIALAPFGSGSVHVAVEIEGEFPVGADANFRQLIVSIAQSTMGTALGLRSALESLAVDATPAGVTLRADFDAHELARGLSLLFRAEIAEALGDPTLGDSPTHPVGTTN